MLELIIGRGNSKIAEGIKIIEISSGESIFLQSQFIYINNQDRFLSFSGMTHVDAIHGANYRETIPLLTNSLKILSILQTGPRWSSLCRWIAWVDPINGLECLVKEITDISFIRMKVRDYISSAFDMPEEQVKSLCYEITECESFIDLRRLLYGLEETELEDMITRFGGHVSI